MKKIRVSNFHKVLALLLAFATLLPVVFASNIIPFADNLEDAFMRDFAIVDCKGVFAHATIRLYKNPIQTPNDYIAPKDLPDEFVVEFSFTDSATGKVWYILDTDNWDNWADDAAYCYVKADDVNLLNTEVVDGEGKEVGEYIIVDGENYDNNFHKYFIAKTGLVGDLSYQWQVLYDAKWVDIRGETENQIKLTHGKIHSLMDADRIYFRCVVTNGRETSCSPMHCIHVQHSQDTVQNDYYAHAQSSFALQTVGNDVMPLDENGAKQTYNIVINYVFENNEIVSDPYTANLAEGSSFSATVTFPTVQGYLPYIGETQQDSIELNYPSVSEDVTIYVVYKPTNVDYTVIHYQQNVDNDQYTVAETETLQGLTGSQVPEVAKTYEGFYHLLYETPAIAADGSTVIEIYYDRYYYLMNFDMDGGYGTDPVYARYGAAIGNIKDPTKAGYTFQGWSETEGGTEPATIPTTMPANNSEYHAIWKVGDTAKVTVVFWGENADDEGYSYLSDFTKEIYLKPGTEFTYSETGMLTCTKESHTHGDDCLGCGKVEHTHTAVGGSCYTLTCTIENHTHGTDCYAGVGSESWSGSAGKPNNPSEGQVYVGRRGTYIYIKGTWYDYTGSTASGSIAPTTCGKNESTHTHGNDCYTLTCTTEEHTHDQRCYSCGKEQHTHNSDCYMQGVGLDSKLWKFVKSDTVTVAADGSTVVNVYYDRVEYSVQFYTRSNNPSEYTNLRITAKWGAYVGDKWPTVNGSSSWYVNAQGSYSSDPMQARLLQMPVGGDKFYGPQIGEGSATAYYYVEKVDSTNSSNTANYEEHHRDTIPSDNATVTTDDMYAINGFTFNSSLSTQTGSRYDNAKFYYIRNSYKLTFNDGYSVIKTESVKYEAALGGYAFTPTPPSAYEPGSVMFGGWYQNPQCTGEEYKLDEHKMPANDMILYAKWVPVNHNVKFYLTEDAEKTGSIYHPKDVDQDAQFTVPHGDNIAEEYVKSNLTKEAMNVAKPNGDYTFVMWYYYEDGVKKPFDPTTQIRKDLTLYGEWSSNTLKQYTVQYVLKDDHSVKVADDLTGAGLAGTTKTFDAKGGTDLYAAYQEGYFPTVQSQSLLLDIDKDSLVITFEYVPMPAVPYTVKYVEKDTGKSLADDKVVSDNRKAVVTETFKPIRGYMPDAYQKRLVVTADGENILYFYYTKDDAHALYIINHFTQNTDGTTWTQYASSTATGDIGTRYTASQMTIPGFTYDHIEYVVNGTQDTDVTAEGAELTANGLEINLYYVRKEYPYQVRYLEQGTGKVLHDPKNGTGKYGQVISESAIDIDNYDKVDPTSATLNIRIDEGEGAPKLNIITFYYKEKEVTINYVAVGPAGVTNFGSVSPTTETVKVASGTAQGSTATPGDGFKFVGWYKDAACTTLISTDAHYTPAKVDGKNVAATYYAKFEYDVTSLTIKKVLAEGTTAEEGTKFIFDVKDSSGKLVATVTLAAGGSVTVNGLKVGDTYTVTERDWSWRYEPVDGKTTQTIELIASGNVITFTNTKKNDKWLDKDSSCVNEFKNKTETPTID